jgi:hypothetical protein
VTSTAIYAVGGKKTEQGISVDSVKITTSNPFFGAVVEIEGYKPLN